MRSLCIILSLFISSIVSARTIVVGKDQLVTSLTKAVALARPGDTILLKKGNYREGNIVINKPVKIFGEEGAVLDGERKHEILMITASNVTIRGIRFLNSGYSSINDYA